MVVSTRSGWLAKTGGGPKSIICKEPDVPISGIRLSDWLIKVVTSC
jgi:hypothetical protein